MQHEPFRCLKSYEYQHVKVRRWRVEAETAITEEAILRTEMIGSHCPMKKCDGKWDH
jgi:hypothetical protein